MADAGEIGSKASLPREAWFVVAGGTPRPGDDVYMVSAHSVSPQRHIGRLRVGRVVSLEAVDWITMALVHVGGGAEVDLVWEARGELALRPLAP